MNDFERIELLMANITATIGLNPGERADLGITETDATPNDLLWMVAFLVGTVAGLIDIAAEHHGIDPLTYAQHVALTSLTSLPEHPL